MFAEVKIAILDLYDGYPNEGMRCIKMLIGEFLEQDTVKGNFDVFDVRGDGALPKIEDYDIFISTGGPGSPVVQGFQWENRFFNFLDDLLEHNKYQENKKHLLLICHSFQLMVQHFKFGLVCERKSTSFGVMSVHQTEDAKDEILFEGLENPFWAVDSRDYQVIQPDEEKLKEHHAHILALEKIRPHIPLERAIMGIRLTDEVVGFQFHPEADAEGMQRYFLQADKKMAVVNEHGEDKYEDMILQLNDPDKIQLTESIIIPKFLNNSLKNISIPTE
ncbi:type 1 glutamine amidotransferase [Arcticibacterium luteifluviistationis]|uniref:GMP synthase n=1 Tax=Arcticibacterium luteifluviistationis TaxID=1784714 RepID=A0A2Z4G779_9BACT|nr:GMP synthase [Arcticibacterium luteifluviistationis]AWV97032.1 GMP synthase [Arcticibacterium luteifluviistationis]